MSINVAAFPKTTKPTYPFIAIDRDKGLIVLLSAPGEGVCLQGGDTRFTVGHYTDNWIMTKLTPYYGKITLENTDAD